MTDKNFIDNKLQLWDSVSTTDPKYTKKVNQRGGFYCYSRSITS